MSAINASRVVAGIAGVGGASALALGGYNLGFTDSSRQSDPGIFEMAKDKVLPSMVSEPARDKAEAAFADMAASTDRHSRNWHRSAVALGVSGLAAGGLGVAALMARNPAAAAKLAGGALAAGLGAAVSGGLAYHHYKQWQTDGDAETRLDDAIQMEAAERTRLYASASTDAAPTAPAGGAPNGRAIGNADLEAQYAITYSTSEYAATIDEGVGAVPGIRRALSEQLTGTSDASSASIAAALDANADGKLEGDERKVIAPYVDLSIYKQLRDLAQADGVSMPEMMEATAANAAFIPAAAVAAQYSLAKTVGEDFGPGTSVDWNRVAERADAALEQMGE